MNATALAVEKRIYRFDEFLVDPVRRVLLREGEAVPITPKAFSVLLVLLENQGGLVAKEELIRQVWASSYVSDANLTQNVSSLRKALGERAGDRRYVVTVPGQGYSFAAPVELAREEPAAPAPVPRAMPDPVPAPVPEPAAPLPPVDVPSPGIPYGLRLALGLLVLALVLGLAVFFSRLSSGALAPEEDLGSAAPPRRPSVAVLGFRDLAPSAETRWLGTALVEMLTTELSAGVGVRVISRENVARVHQFVDIQASGTLADGSLSRIRSIVGADRAVVGTYLALREGQDRRIRLDVRVLRVPDGDVLASLVVLGRESELFDLVNRAGASLRQVLGYGEPSPEQALAARALQPADSEALRFYSEGLDRLRVYDAPRGLELLRQAAQADPQSAAIHSALAQALDMLGHDVQAVEEAKRALELSSTLRREERLGLQARLQALSQQWDRASETYRTLWTFYPDNLEYGLQLAGSLMRAGRGGEATETIAALRRLPAPQGEDPRIDVLEARIAARLSDKAAELRAAEAAVAKGRRSGEKLVLAQALVYKGDALLPEGRTDEAVAAFREARRLAQEEGHMYILGMALANLGVALQARGDLAGALAAHREALDIAERLGASLGIAAQLQMLGRLHQQQGELTEALDLLEQSLTWQVRIGDRFNEARTLDAIGLVLATRGDLAGAQQRLERALDISRAIGNRRDEAAALTHLGQVLERQGQLSQALKRHEQAFAVFRQLRDQGQAAEALIESASALARLGNLPAARKRLEHALQAHRRLGDKLGVAEVLDRLSGLAYRMGDLAGSRRLGEREMQIARESGSNFLFVEALRRIGRVDWAAGRLADSRRSFEQALALSAGGGEGTETMGIRLDLARLALSEDRFAEAARLARQASEWYRSRDMAGNEAQGMSLLAEALLRQGRFAEARKAGERAWVQAGKSEDREMRVLVSSRLARVDAAAGGSGEAVRELRQRIGEAQAAGYVNAALQARLALGEVLQAAGDRDRGGATLQEVQRDAAARGFMLLARRAEQALQTGWAGWKGGRKAG